MTTRTDGSDKPAGAECDRKRFDTFLRAAQCRDFNERTMIVFLADMAKAKERFPKLESSAMALKLAMMVLQAYAGQDLNCYPSVPKLASRMNCSRRQAQQTISELQSIDLVAFHDDDDSTASRHYVLNYGRLIEDFVVDPPRWMIASQDDQAAAAVDAPLAKSAAPHGESCHPPRQNAPPPLAKSATKTIIKTERELKPQPSPNGRESASGSGSMIDGTAAGGNADEEFEQRRRDAVAEMMNTGWKMSARKWFRSLRGPDLKGFSEPQIDKRIAQIGNQERFFDLGKILDKRQRIAADKGEEFNPVRYLSWLCDHPEVTFDTAFPAKPKQKFRPRH